MPHSSSAFDHILLDHIKQINPSTILDVGVGAGKYGSIIKNSGFAGQIDGIEPTESYRTEFDLDSKYSTIFPVTLQEFMTRPAFNYDVAIFGDVLEHLYRSQAIDTIDYFLYKCNWLIVIWPNNMPQGAEGDNAYEIHKSNFTISLNF